MIYKLVNTEIVLSIWAKTQINYWNVKPASRKAGI